MCWIFWFEIIILFEFGVWYSNSSGAGVKPNPFIHFTFQIQIPITNSNLLNKLNHLVSWSRLQNPNLHNQIQVISWWASSLHLQNQNPNPCWNPPPIHSQWKQSLPPKSACDLPTQHSTGFLFLSLAWAGRIHPPSALNIGYQQHTSPQNYVPDIWYRVIYRDMILNTGWYINSKYI